MKIDTEKTVNILLYISHNVGRADIHKVFKTLYFAEQAHLAEYGLPIVGDDYIRMPYGPVPSEIFDWIKVIRGDNSRSVESEFSAYLKRLFAIRGKFVLVPKEQPDMDWLAETELDCLNRSIERNKDKSFNDLSELSHDSAWNSVSLNSPMPLLEVAKAGGADSELLQYIKLFFRKSRDISLMYAMNESW